MEQEKIERAIETLKHLTLCGSCTTGPCNDCDRKNAKDTALKALETVAKIPKVIEELEKEITEKDDWQFTDAEIAYWNKGIRRSIDIIKDKLCGGVE